ncbi:hypothetical protein PRZ48_008695 [Zasmidium cellare]|uniref:Mnd1 HTH domain-containing protein n=1 Tax=Zasmidium cellare TaxID=395010 RepID=A0ABR0EG66_ZASCE|nr:hypothetical protein PRZ48_008695 [Zasmidium cellare]
MAKGIECKPAKLAAIVAHMQKSKVCWNLKDLEKQIPSIASINGMHTKDYIQNLQDENRICVEKIGSGNWYWSFASTDKRKKQKALEDAQAANGKISAVVEELRAKVKENSAAREEEEGEDSGEVREECMAKKAVLEADLKALDTKLAAYSANDPEELERKEEETKALRDEATKYTDDLYSMEGWFKKKDMEQALTVFRMSLYGDEWDTEEYDFKDF